MNIIEYYQKPGLLSRFSNYMNASGAKHGYGTPQQSSQKIDNVMKLFSDNYTEFKAELDKNLRAIQQASAAIRSPQQAHG